MESIRLLRASRTDSSSSTIEISGTFGVCIPVLVESFGAGAVFITGGDYECGEGKSIIRRHPHPIPWYRVRKHIAASLVTPKACASSSPGLEQPWVRSNKNESNAESVGDNSQRFQRCKLVGDVDPTSLVTPKACASSSPGLKQPWVRSNKNGRQR